MKQTSYAVLFLALIVASQAGCRSEADQRAELTVMETQSYINDYWESHGRLPDDTTLTRATQVHRPGGVAVDKDWVFSCRPIPEAGPTYYLVRVRGNGVSRSFGTDMDADVYQRGLAKSHPPRP